MLLSVARRKCMVDIKNPTEQFHSYQPMNATPQSQTGPTGGNLMSSVLNGLSKVNVGEMMNSWKGSMSNMNMGDSVTKVRNAAAANPGRTIGTMAALVIGAGLLSRRGRLA